MSKHTPGEWFTSRPNRTIYIESRIGGGMLQEVAACGPTEATEQQEANAQLIAAAPELLEACKTMAEWFKREHEGFPNAGQVRTTPAGEAAWRKWWEENLRLCGLAKTQANAAIAKATE